jgi:hypothetical protein
VQCDDDVDKEIDGCALSGWTVWGDRAQQIQIPAKKKRFSPRTYGNSRHPWKWLLVLSKGTVLHGQYQVQKDILLARTTFCYLH